MSADTILIASNSNDRATTVRVTKVLQQKGFKVINYETDRILDGGVHSEIRLDPEKGATIVYGKQHFSDATIGAAWLRRPADFAYVRDDRTIGDALAYEARKTFANVWGLIAHHKWLNEPDDMIRAQHKLPQLEVARSLGLTIPETVITNSWEDIRKIGPKSIMKMAYKPVLYEGREGKSTKILYTTVLDEAKITQIEHTSPFPGIYEPFIPKKREWRITIVGDAVFSAAIYTSKKSSDDWRKYQSDSSLVQFKDEPLPDSTIIDKCKALLRHYGLRYGAFDFIETPNNEMIFLEVNPNGQYGWLEHQLGFPISKAIADQLIAIAKA